MPIHVRRVLLCVPDVGLPRRRLEHAQEQVDAVLFLRVRDGVGVVTLDGLGHIVGLVRPLVLAVRLDPRGEKI